MSPFHGFIDLPFHGFIDLSFHGFIDPPFPGITDQAFHGFIGSPCHSFIGLPFHGFIGLPFHGFIDPPFHGYIELPCHGDIESASVSSRFDIPLMASCGIAISWIMSLATCITHKAIQGAQPQGDKELSKWMRVEDFLSLNDPESPTIFQ